MPPAGDGSGDLAGKGRDWSGYPRIRAWYERILAMVKGGPGECFPSPP